MDTVIDKLDCVEGEVHESGEARKKCVYCVMVDLGLGW